MNDNYYWVTKKDGVVQKKNNDEKLVFDNDNFVTTIFSDDSPMSKIMRSFYPTETTITLMNDKEPESWTRWEKKNIVPKNIEKILSDFPQEIPLEERLTVSRGEQSKRTRSVLSSAYMSVTPRGIKNKEVPPTPEDSFASLVSIVYHLIEKNTVASLKTKDNTVSPDKKEKIEYVYNIVHNRGNVIDVALLSSYVEPSPTLINRTYELSSLYGVYTVHAIVNDVYYRTFIEQVREIEKLWENIQ